jgi:hypothetical protein
MRRSFGRTHFCIDESLEIGHTGSIVNSGNVTLPGRAERSLVILSQDPCKQEAHLMVLDQDLKEPFSLLWRQSTDYL